MDKDFENFPEIPMNIDGLKEMVEAENNPIQNIDELREIVEKDNKEMGYFIKKIYSEITPNDIEILDKVSLFTVLKLIKSKMYFVLYNGYIGSAAYIDGIMYGLLLTGVISEDKDRKFILTDAGEKLLQSTIPTVKTLLKCSDNCADCEIKDFCKISRS